MITPKVIKEDIDNLKYDLDTSPKAYIENVKYLLNSINVIIENIIKQSEYLTEMKEINTGVLEDLAVTNESLKDLKHIVADIGVRMNQRASYYRNK